MNRNREIAGAFDLLAKELLKQAKCAEDVARKLNWRKIEFADLSAATGIVEDLGNCLSLARGAKSMLKLGRRK